MAKKIRVKKTSSEIPEKYKHIDFKPTEDVANVVSNGLELRKMHNKGGTKEVIQQALLMKNREAIHPDDVRNLVSFFSENEINKKTAPEKGLGMIAWQLHGGDVGQQWANEILAKMKQADETLHIDKYYSMDTSGGMHGHEAPTGQQETMFDGEHRHFFVVNSVPVFTEYDGGHSHGINLETSKTTGEFNRHQHMIKIGGDLLMTDEAPDHNHELQDGWTNCSGAHRHKVELPTGEILESLLVSDLLKAEIRKRVSLQVHAIEVSASRFKTLEEATAYVASKEFEVSDYLKTDGGYLFRQMARERFKEETLQSFTLSDGVTAIVGMIDFEKLGPGGMGLMNEIDPSKKVLTDEQFALVARLQDKYAMMVSSLRERIETLAPTFNLFATLVDEHIMNPGFQNFLNNFIVGYQILIDQLGQMNLPEVALDMQEKTVKAFAEPIIKELGELRDIFEGNEDFGGFGDLLAYNHEGFKHLVEKIEELEIEKQLKEANKDYLWQMVSKSAGGYDKEMIIEKASEEERTIFGEVLIPEEVDAHGDIYSAFDVEKAAHYFMENFGNMGLMHSLLINDDVKILETWVAPIDMVLKTSTGSDRVIKKGTWLMKARVISDLLWDKIKSGELTGFSIGGLATVSELKKLK
jgi:hypothetical protein